MFRFRERIVEELMVKRFTTMGHCSWSWLTVRLSCFRGIIGNATLENEEVGPHGRRYLVKIAPNCQLPIGDLSLLAHNSSLMVPWLGFIFYCIARSTADEDIVSDSVSCVDDVFLARDYYYW